MATQSTALTLVQSKPWDQLPDESQKCFEAFLVYLGLNKFERTVIAAYRKKTGKENKPNGWWLATSTRFRWKERGKAYDEYTEGLSEFDNQTIVLLQKLDVYQRGRFTNAEALEKAAHRLIKLICKKIAISEKVETSLAKNTDEIFTSKEIMSIMKQYDITGLSIALNMVQKTLTATSEDRAKVLQIERLVQKHLPEESSYGFENNSQAS